MTGECLAMGRCGKPKRCVTRRESALSLSSRPPAKAIGALS